MNRKGDSTSCHVPFCVTVFVLKLYHFVTFYFLDKLIVNVDSSEFCIFAYPGMFKCQDNEKEQILQNKYDFVDFIVMKTQSALVITESFVKHK